MVKVKRLRWGGNMAQNLVCRYELEVNSDKKWLAVCHAFMWRGGPYNSRKVAVGACQRHYESVILDLLEPQDGAGSHPID